MEKGQDHEFRRRCDRLKWARLRAPGEFKKAEVVAMAVHRDVSTVYGWETQRKELKDIDTVLNLSFLYDVSFAWLAFGLGQPGQAIAAMGEDVLLSFWRSCTPDVQRAALQLCISIRDELMKN